MSVTATAPVRESARKDVLIGLGIGVVATTLSYVVGFVFGWITEVSYLEAFAVFTSYTCTYLCVKERRINYPIGAISNAAYAFLFYSFGLMGSAVVTAYLTFSLIYGWFRWKKDSETKPVGYVERRYWKYYLLATAAAFAGGFGIYHLTGAQVVWTDLVVMAGSILAQFLLDNKKMENWYAWIVVNVFAIYTYINSGLYIAGFQYIFFLGNAFYGIYVWRKSMKAETFPVQSGTSEVREAVTV